MDFANLAQAGAFLGVLTWDTAVVALVFAIVLVLAVLLGKKKMVVLAMSHFTAVAFFTMFPNSENLQGINIGFGLSFNVILYLVLLFGVYIIFLATLFKRKKKKKGSRTDIKPKKFIAKAVVYSLVLSGSIIVTILSIASPELLTSAFGQTVFAGDIPRVGWHIGLLFLLAILK